MEEKKNDVWVEDGVVHYRINAPVDEGEAERLDREGRLFLEDKKASCIVIDLQQSSDFSSAARKVWVKFLQHPDIKKTAIFGGNVFVKTLASFVIAATGVQNIKFFPSQEEALVWVKTIDS